MIPGFFKDWENAGLSMAAVVEALLYLELPQKLGVTADQLPHYMLLAFAATVLLRKVLNKRAAGTEAGESDGR